MTIYQEWPAATLVWLLAGLHGALGLWWLLAPRAATRALAAFPRARAVGWGLTLIATLWVALMVQQASLGRFAYLKAYLWPAAAVSYAAMVWALDELLAARALGGLLLLAAQPLLVAVRWHPSAARLLVVALAYGWVVAGMTLTLSPYWFRRAAAFASKTPLRLRLAGLLALSLAALFSLLAYRWSR